MKYLSSTAFIVLTLLFSLRVNAANNTNQQPILARDYPVIVQILKAGSVISWGSGVLIDSGSVLTAAHVVDELQEDMSIRILYGHRYFPASITLLGYRQGPDLAYLQLSEPIEGWNSKKLEACQNELSLGREVYVLAAQTSFKSSGSVNPPFVVYSQNKQFTNHLSSFLDNGTSGGGVFDPERMCLLGIISKAEATQSYLPYSALGEDPNSQPKVTDYGTAFTGAADISKFLKKAQLGALKPVP